ncbi:uncharacterized protein AKAME5_000000600 [Lates japonicus]|uniref:Uncharacterized protein n=1 Tax=Lates japonicus TaxID=270547 RepID=A0AAD3QTW0_LATJO|nr:uncharacterized protein AKAME5_000000600 [Lates japonicus]
MTPALITYWCPANFTLKCCSLPTTRDRPLWGYKNSAISGPGSTGQGFARMWNSMCTGVTPQKGPTQRSHAPLQQYQVGAPMEWVVVKIMGLFPTTE